VEPAPGRLESGRQAEGEAGQQRHGERETQGAAVDGDIAGPGQILRGQIQQCS
jgi:hypothetical protein